MAYDNICSNINHNPPCNKAWSETEATAKACESEGKKR